LQGNKQNPNCLHGIIPAPGSYKKKGLWQRNMDDLLDLGPDPNDALRTVSI
jgi:hypothetical protein